MFRKLLLKSLSMKRVEQRDKKYPYSKSAHHEHNKVHEKNRNKLQPRLILIFSFMQSSNFKKRKSNNENRASNNEHTQIHLVSLKQKFKLNFVMSEKY